MANLSAWLGVALFLSEALALIPGIPAGYEGIIASVISILKKLSS